MLKLSKSILTGVLLFASLFLNGESLSERKNIIVGKGSGFDNSTEIPNTLSQIPISCSFDDGTGELEICFLDDIGYVATTVTAFGTGVVASTMVDSSLGIVQLFLPVTPGFYEISFVTAGGDIYSGSFSI